MNCLCIAFTMLTTVLANGQPVYDVYAMCLKPLKGECTETLMDTRYPKGDNGVDWVIERDEEYTRE